jgi:hypothetical protein
MIGAGIVPNARTGIYVQSFVQRSILWPGHTEVLAQNRWITIAAMLLFDLLTRLVKKP